MVKKLRKISEEKKAPAGAPLAGTVKDSAQQIWLAGLGAFAKAQEEGGKVFEALVKEGLSIQRKTQAAAEEKITEAAGRVASMANGISSKATGQWDKLETIFEERVSRALNKLGVPSAKDIDVLVARIEELQRSVEKLATRSGAADGDAPVRKAPRAKVKAPAAAPAAPVEAAEEAGAGSGTKPARKRAAARKAAEEAAAAG
jgi:poly(hydroxyalkanoate) granule-associated protein